MTKTNTFFFLNLVPHILRAVYLNMFHVSITRWLPICSKALWLKRNNQCSHSSPFTTFEIPKQTENSPQHKSPCTHVVYRKHILLKKKIYIYILRTPQNHTPPSVRLKKKKKNQIVQIHLPSLKFQQGFCLCLE